MARDFSLVVQKRTELRLVLGVREIVVLLDAVVLQELGLLASYKYDFPFG